MPDGFTEGYPFKINVVNIPHGGISAARNAGLKYSDSEWIMYCDSDDAFLCTTSLQTFFRYMTEDKVLVTSAFFEEAPSYEDGRIVLLWHDGRDYIFVHGKAFRRDWLLKNKIKFHDELKLHEDTYFVAMAKYLAAEQNVVTIRDPLYLWQYNKVSVSRSYDNFVLETYDQLLKKNAALTDELLRRGMFVQAKGIVCRSITDAYCRLHSKKWNTQKNAELIKDAEDSVAIFLKKYGYIYRGSDPRQIEANLNDLRDLLVKRDEFDLEYTIPFDKWVEELSK